MKSQRISLSVSPSLREAWQARATAAGMKLTAWLRKRASPFEATLERQAFLRDQWQERFRNRCLDIIAKNAYCERVLFPIALASNVVPSYSTAVVASIDLLQFDIKPFGTNGWCVASEGVFLERLDEHPYRRAVPAPAEMGR